MHRRRSGELSTINRRIVPTLIARNQRFKQKPRCPLARAVETRLRNQGKPRDPVALARRTPGNLPAPAIGDESDTRASPRCRPETQTLPTPQHAANQTAAAANTPPPRRPLRPPRPTERSARPRSRSSRILLYTSRPDRFAPSLRDLRRSADRWPAAQALLPPTPKPPRPATARRRCWPGGPALA